MRGDTVKQKSRAGRQGQREDGKGIEARGSASNDLGQPQHGARAGPEAAQTPSPDMRWRQRGTLPRGVGSRAQSPPAGSGPRTLGGVRREAAALSAVLKPRRAAGEVRRGARRCAVPGPQGRRDESRQGRAGGPRALSPETPRSLTLPGAEQKRQDSGGTHGGPGR